MSQLRVLLLAGMGVASGVKGQTNSSPLWLRAISSEGQLVSLGGGVSLEEGEGRPLRGRLGLTGGGYRRLLAIDSLGNRAIAALLVGW